MINYTISELWGSVRFRACGLRPVRLLDAAQRENIRLYRVRRLDETTLEATVSLAGLEKLKQAVPEGSYAFTVRQTRGVRAMLKRILARPVLAAGILLTFPAVQFLSGQVLFVRVYGTAAENAVREQLEGETLAGLDSEGSARLEEKILTAHPEFKWASVEKDGVFLNIYVREKLQVERTDSTPGDILAGKDCRIRSIDVTSGIACVKPGDIVSAGDVLIRGEATYGGVSVPVAAEGSVTADVWYYDSVELPLEETVSVRTERTEQKRSLVFAGIELPLAGKTSFEQYETESVTERYGLLEIRKITVYEMRTVTRAADPEQTAAAAAEALRPLLLERAQGEITEEKIWTETDHDGFLRVCMYAETVESVGKKQDGDQSPVS